MVSSIPNHRIRSGIRARPGMARLIWTGPSISASPTRLSPASSARTAPTSDAEEQPQPGALGGDGEVFLQPAVGDQLTGGGHHGPGFGQDPGVQQAGCRAGGPEQQQRRRAQQPGEPPSSSGSQPFAGGPDIVAAGEGRVLVGFDGGAFQYGGGAHGVPALAAAAKARAGDRLEAGVVEVRGLQVRLLLFPGQQVDGLLVPVDGLGPGRGDVPPAG